MTNDKMFPNVEPPPHPEAGGASPPAIDPKLQGIMEPATQAQPQAYIDPSQNPPQNPQSPIAQQVVNQLPKKGLPKPLIFALIGLVLVIFIFIIVFIFKGGGGGGGTVGTKGEITWWGVENDGGVVSPLIDEYQQKNPGVKITYVKQSPQDYRERLTSAIASGNGPDVFEIHNSWVPMFKNDLSVLPEGIMKKEDYVKSFYPVVSSDFNQASGIVALPLAFDALTLYVNDSIFTSALRSPPVTWDELNQLAKVLTQRNQNNVIIQAGVGVGLTENVEYWPEIMGLMLFQNGVDLAKPQGSQVKFALLYFTHFTNPDKVWDSSQPLSGTAFAKGKLAMYFAPTSNAKNIIDSNPSLRFRTVPLPQLPKEKPTDPDFSYATYWAEAVWKRSINSDLAWDFIKFMSSPESLQKMNQNRKTAGVPEKIYPRPEMGILQEDDRVLGSVVKLAPYAKSWYLADKTSDGQTGINFQINKIFSDTIEASTQNRDADKVIKELPTKIEGVLSKYNARK